MTNRATPEEYEYLMTRGFYDVLGTLRVFERKAPINGREVESVVMNSHRTPAGWCAYRQGGHGSMGATFPDPITAFVDAEIRNWGRT